MSDFRLKAFYSVARNLSFTKASQELFVSQPAVTKHVRELESLYSVRLFDRKGNSISLTEAGKLLMEHCERILDDYRKLEYDMHQLNNEYVGELVTVRGQYDNLTVCASACAGCFYGALSQDECVIDGYQFAQCGEGFAGAYY